MRNTNKKGFTIVELVIVVAVIAILAAVLIPTFSGIIAKANLSADQQAVRNMNVALASANKTPTNIIDAAGILAEAGFNTEKGLTPAYKGHAFYWFKPTNQVVYVNEADGKFELIFPEKVEGFTEIKTDDCKSLEIAITGTVNVPTVPNNTTITGTNISTTSVPDHVNSFESAIEWVNTLDDNINGALQIKCKVNGVEKPGIVISDDIKLTKDVVVDVHAGQSTLAINIEGDVTIDLNGYSITQYGQVGLSMCLFVVRDGATLNIVDSSAEKTGGIYASYSAFQLDTGSTLNIYGGTIGVTPEENRNSGDYVQLVFMYGGTLNMYGGIIDATAKGVEDEAIGYDGEWGAKVGNTVNLYGGKVVGSVNLEYVPSYIIDVTPTGKIKYPEQ